VLFLHFVLFLFCIRLSSLVWFGLLCFLLRGGLAIVAMRQLPRGFCNLPYKMSQKEARCSR
jgi:hypothetical protein